MNRYIQRQMIVWTLVLVTVLGLAVAMTILNPPDRETASRPIPGRLPAALALEPVPEPTAPTVSVATATDLELECGKEFATIVQTNIRQIRFSGGYCGKKAKRAVLASHVLNVTNGFVATVFYPQNTAYTTDYISLAEGENTIRFEHRFDDGSREDREIKVSRKPTAEQK